MFKLNIPVTKSYLSKESNVLIIEGIATDSTIDRDSERFSEEAVKSMYDSVNGGVIPMKIEHGDNIFSEVGVWKEASMTEDGKMFVKGEVDLDLSFGKDIQVLLNKGMVIALSVGGMVKEAVNEFSSELGKNIRTYKDIILKEISIVKNPANFNATLSIAKSFNSEKNIETEEAVNLNKDANFNIKAESNFDKSISNIENIIKSVIKTKDEVYLVRKSKITKACCPTLENEFFEPSELNLEDYRIIGMIYRIFAAIGANEIKAPKGLETWEEIDSLSDYSFLPIASDRRLIAYLNPDFTLNREWIKFGMYALASGQYSWINSSDRTYAMEFLYSAYKQTLVSEKSFTRDITSDEIELMKSCTEFKVNKGIRPQFEGNDLSDTEISKLSKAYSILIERNILKNNSEKTMNEQELKALIAKYTADLEALEVKKTETIALVDTDIVTEEVAEIVVEETVTEEVVNEIVEEVVKTEEIIEEAVVENVDTEIVTEEVTKDTEIVEVTEDVVSEDTVIVEELNADTTKNNTSITEESILKTITEAIAIAMKSESEKIENSILELQKSFDSKIAEMKEESEVAISKSVSSKVEKEEELSKSFNDVLENVKTLTETVKSFGEASSNRKSFATVLNKSSAITKSVNDLIDEEMKTNGNDYTKARVKVLSSI